MSYEGDIGVDVGEVKVIAQTGSAILCRQIDDGTQAWVPLSQIHDDSEVRAKGDEGILIISTWFSHKIDWRG